MDELDVAESSATKIDSTADQERAVGITALVSSKVPGFQCTIKHRYTDFLVNEILPNGQVLHLTDLGGGKLRSRTEGRDDKVSAETINGTTGVQDKHDATAEGSSLKRHDRDDDNADGDGSESSSKKPRLNMDVDQNTAEPGSQIEPKDSDLPIKERVKETISQVPQVDQAVLQGIFGEPTTSRILNLYANVILHPDRKPRDHTTVKSDVITEKSKRTEAHVAVRRIFASKLETATLQDVIGVISVKAASTKGPSGARGRAPIDDNGQPAKKGKLAWDELGGEYLHFNLYKENKDTMEVLYFLASKLKVPVKNFQFAGTKDRRAVTVQRVAIFRVHAKGIAELNKTAKGWRAGDFEYKTHGLELGELGGNEFLLTLRDCSFKGDASFVHEQKVVLARRILEQATESFTKHGFLNYYGLQRFGSFSTGTHVTGQKMLSGDLKGAIASILTFSQSLLSVKQDGTEKTKIPQDDIDRAEAIQMFCGGRTNDAVRKMPKRFQAEAAIIQYLGKKDRNTGQRLQERDWQGALTQIPRNLRMMYVHAYQSFIWNTVAGKRWELYGNRVVEGDLVIVGEKDNDIGPSRDEVDEDGEPIFHPAADDSAPNTEDDYTRARHLSKAEAASGKYDIFDVVLPLPGYDVLYPANSVGEFYKDFMASEAGGGIDPHEMRRSWKDISLSGAYRKLLARPSSALSFVVKSYVDDTEQMIQTDLERIESHSSSNTTNGAELDGQSSQQTSAIQAKKLAIVLKFGLGTSQYATMALRELTKGGAMHYRPDFSAR